MRSKAIAAIIVLLSTAFAVWCEDANENNSIQGTWQLVTGEVGGQKMAAETAKSIQLTIKDDTYTVSVGGRPDKGTIQLHPAEHPKALDITGTEGPNQGKRIAAIYERTGDTLRICYNLGGKTRPTAFESKPGTSLFLAQYKLQKP